MLSLLFALMLWPAQSPRWSRLGYESLRPSTRKAWVLENGLALIRNTLTMQFVWLLVQIGVLVVFLPSFATSPAIVNGLIFLAGVHVVIFGAGAWVASFESLFRKLIGFMIVFGSLHPSWACVVWNLVPVFAQYRLDQPKHADLKQQRRHPPVATVEVAQDSPWPGSTIDMRGRAIAGLDDQNLPMADIEFGQLGQMLVTSGGVSLIDTASAMQLRSLNDGSDVERLFAAAISGDGKVIATVGQFTPISFWKAAADRGR